jgi:hypothetical protein
MLQFLIFGYKVSMMAVKFQLCPGFGNRKGFPESSTLSHTDEEM